MQYILTQEEYTSLKEEKNFKIIGLENIINELCQRVCDNEPVKGKEPWGCIHSIPTQHYCNSCPVLGYCTRIKNYRE